MTQARFDKVKRILQQRQLDVTVLLEQVHKPHNLSAIMRTCDAVGIQEMHAVELEGAVRTFKTATQGSHKWVDLHVHKETQTAVEKIKAQGMKLYAAHFSERAVDFRSIDYTQPACIVMGTELDGISKEMESYVDGDIIIPMQGMIASLNVSVACATILYEMQRQRHEAGLYERNMWNEKVYQTKLFEWMQPKMARFYRERNMPYPELDEDGDILKV